MQRLKKVLPLVVLVGLTAGSAFTQNVVVLTPDKAKSAGGAVTADDTAVALLCRYTGVSTGGGEIAVAAGGDVTFTVATAADTTFECPVSGGLGGIMDVSDTACDTLGEFVDIVNGVSPVATTDFKCVILDGLRSDSTNDTFLTFSAATADAQAGLAINWDSDVALHVSRAVVPPEARRLDFYLQGNNLRARPFSNTKTYVTWAWEDTGTCTGADTFRIVALSNWDPKVAETAQFIYGPIATNTTTPVEFSNLSNSPVFSNTGAKVVAREACATTFATGLLSVAGYQIPLGN